MTEKTKKCYMYILVVSLFLIVPLISTKYFIGHDTIYHTTLIKLLKIKLINLDFSPIIPIIARGFGYGTYIFYPKLPHFIGAIINIVVNNEFISIKIVHFLVILLSAIFMFKLIKLITKKDDMSLLGSIFYMTMPYFISDNFIRDSLNECFIFLFMPIVLIGLISLFNKDKKNFYIYFILGYIGMVNSHLVLSIYFTIALLVFLLINIKQIISKDNIRSLVIASIIILIMIMPSVIMLIEHKSINLHTVFNNKIMRATVQELRWNTVPKKSYIFMDNKMNSIYFFINLVVYILATLGTIFVVFKEKDIDKKRIIIGLIFFTIFSVLLTSRLFPYQYMPKLLLSIQFPFRCLSFVNFSISIIAAYGLSLITKNNKHIIFICILICTLVGVFCVNSQEYIKITDIDKRQELGMGWEKEYLPFNTHNNQKYLNNRNHDIKILSDNKATIKIIYDETPNMKFNIDNVKESTKIEIPRLYYLGYNIKLKTKDNKTENIKYSYNENGFITTNIKKSGTVTIKYTGTLLYRITSIIRLISIITIVSYLMKKRRKKDD